MIFLIIFCHEIVHNANGKAIEFKSEEEALDYIKIRVETRYENPNNFYITPVKKMIIK